MYQQKEKNYVSVVLYVHNNANIIEKMILELDALLTENFSNFEIILVNDFSEDESIEKVKTIKEQLNATVSVLNLSYYHGLEMAMTSGQKMAIGDYIFEMDTMNVDYNLSELINIYHTSLKGFDIVALSPKKKASLFNRIFYNLLEKSSLLKMRLYTETARIISRRAINRVGILNTSVNYRKATYHYSGLPTKNVFYEPLKDSKYNELSFGSKFNLAYEIMIRYSHIASTISIGLSFFFFAFSVFMIGYVIASYIIVQNIASGWTTTMMFLTISFSGLFLVLSMILKYLDTLLRDKSINKTYVYDSIEQIKTKWVKLNNSY